MNKVIQWNEEKNQLLQLQRGLSFEMVLEKLLNGHIPGRKSHPDKKQYPHQHIFVMELNDYVCYVPFVKPFFDFQCLWYDDKVLLNV